MINYLNNNNVNTYVLKEENNLVGFYEQIFNKENSDFEIAYFGILEEYIGKRLGGYLLSEAIKISWTFKIHRTWVHTCSLDHKNALNNYLARGMSIFHSETIKKNIN